MTFPYSQGVSPQRVMEIWEFKHANTSGTCTASKGPGVLGRINVNGGVLGELVVYDNTAASGANVIADITAPSGGQTFQFNALCTFGCSVFASAATDFTVTFAGR